MKKAKLHLALVVAGTSLFGSGVSASFFPQIAINTSIAARAVQPEDSVATFWASFKAAVIAGDKAKVAAMSRFPITRGYGMASIRTKAQFTKRFRDVFFNETDAAQCFPRAKPVVDKQRPNEFSVSCPFKSDSSGEEPFVYTFTRTRAGWKLTSFENINE